MYQNLIFHKLFTKRWRRHFQLEHKLDREKKRYPLNIRIGYNLSNRLQTKIIKEKKNRKKTMSKNASMKKS